MIYKEPLWFKLKLLLTVLLLKWGILKRVRVCTEIDNSLYKEKIFDKAEWQTSLNGVIYKVAIDPSGEQRYKLKGIPCIFRVNRHNILFFKKEDVATKLGSKLDELGSQIEFKELLK